MPKGTFQADFRETRMRLMALIGVLMLSIDAINPVKVLGSILQLGDVLGTYVAMGALGFALNLIYANAKEFAYFSTKVFFTSIMNIFFSSIEVLGRENIPQHGPIIFCGNHMNQFVDGAVALVTCPHKLNFLIAESSMSKPIIGTFARAIGSLPIYRPIDNAKPGLGNVCIDGQMLLGEGTKFSEVDLRDRIRPKGSAKEYRIIKVLSDTEAMLSNGKGEPAPQEETVCQGRGNWVGFDMLGFVDQSNTFRKVHEALAKGENLIIFPEGGSHDNTDLQPLKAGIASIAFGTLETSTQNVTIVPIGLNYFRGHRFRGRVVVEYGEPIHITPDLVKEYRSNRREAYQRLLGNVEDGMRGVIVTAPNYNELLLIHTMRRLYQRSSAGFTLKRKQDLARRFSVAFRLMKDKYKRGLPGDVVKLKDRLEDYQAKLQQWGIYDYQVNNLGIPYSKLLYTFVHGFFIMVIASIPTLILNAPVGVAAKYWAKAQAKKALAKSKIKIDGRDVLLTNKIVFSIVAIPMLWVLYAVVLYAYFRLEIRTIVLAFLCMPIASYIGVRSAEAGMVDLKDLRPAFLRLLPGFPTEAKVLPGLRTELAREVRTVVKRYGPDMGALYSDPSDHWEQDVRLNLSKSVSADLLSSMGGDDVDDKNKLQEEDEEEAHHDSISALDEKQEGERVPSGVSRRPSQLGKGKIE
jgi:glycerol-3-phosphate O-acyltransferase/dihydroxyacetone phosphate acyltransferase